MATKTNKQAIAPDGSMSLMGHIKEFRNRLIVCAVVFLVTCGVGLSYGDVLIDIITQLGRDADYQFQTTGPTELLLEYFKMAILAAVIVTLPIAMYNIWAFAKPGLKKQENLFFGSALVFCVILFCIGVAFAYFVTVPFMLNFLNTLPGADYVKPDYKISEYNSFVVMVFTVFGSVFEMPLLSAVLAKMGIANPTIMRKFRGGAIVVIFLVGALITPPDIVSQTMVAIPMIILYEISILIAQALYRKRVDTDDDEDEDEDEE